MKEEPSCLINMADEVLSEDGAMTSISEERKRSESGKAFVSLFDLIRRLVNVFQRSKKEDDEEELKWPSIERLPTFDRMKKGILKQVLDTGRVKYEEVDITKLGIKEKKLLQESILNTTEEDDEKFLYRIKDKTDRVAIEIPKIEVRFKHLSVKGDAYLGPRALLMLLNSALNIVDVFSLNKKLSHLNSSSIFVVSIETPMS